MIECYFCGRKATEIDAVAAGWSASYFDPARDRYVGRVVCPDCCRSRLAWNPAHDDYELLPGARPFADTPAIVHAVPGRPAF